MILAPAAPATAATHHGSPHDEATSSRMSTPAPAAVERGTSPTPTTQPHSDHGVCSQSPASAAPPTTVTHHRSPRDEAPEPHTTPAPAGSAACPSAGSPPHRDHSAGSQGPASAAAAPQSHPREDATVSRLRSVAHADRQTSPSPTAAQPHSDRSDHSQTPATATPPSSAATNNPPPHNVAESHLPSLSAEEKNRRLNKAAEEGAVGELEALLAAGADVGARDEERLTALHWAAAEGREEAARRLLAAGAAVDDRDSDQWTPLHFAAWGGHAAVVRLLLAANADHSARDAHGMTPLHWAAFKGHRPVAVALLSAGADRGARDSDGRTPLDIDRLFNFRQLEQLLQGGCD